MPPLNSCGEAVTVLFDTDVFIWLQKGNIHAAEVIESSRDRQISLQTYLELLQTLQSG